MTERVRVDLGTRSYDILVGSDLVETAGPLISTQTRARTPVVVTDETVAALHLDRLQQALAAAGIGPAPAIILPAGEKTKDFHHFERLVNDILGFGVERSTVLIALGGGVIGDITGFAAATVLRGVDFIQIPTTLLAQVDSSVGGKTGINAACGKNLVGAFHQPRLVLADTGVLGTLPRRELLAGYAEVVKYGLIRFPDFYAWLETDASKLINGDPEALRHAISVSCRAKAAIVGADERESGERALLNFGHTFAHAFEASAGYDGRLLHGEAVSIGMVMAFDLSARMGLCPKSDGERLRQHLNGLGMMVSPRQVTGVAWDADTLIANLAHDKKMVNGKVSFVLTRGIGTAHSERDIDANLIRAVFSDALNA